MVVLWVLADCGCPDFDDIEVKNRTAHDDGFVQEAIDQFAVWTGRDGVCIETVVLRDSLTQRGHEVARHGVVP